jgi:hypothetical protein
MTLSDSSATNIIRGNLQIDGGVTSLSATSIDVTGNLSASNLTLDSDLTVHGIANLDSTNVVGQLDVSGSITATNFTVSGAFTTAGATRNAASFVVTNDGATVTNTNRAGLAVDRPSLDSAVIQWNELGDFWEIGTNQTDGGSSSDLKRVARQNDSAVFTNLMQSGTGATRIPAGTTAQRPSSEQGQIRYNTTNASFEGYSGSAWSGLGGLIDVDGDTKVLAERSAGNDSDTLTFFTAGVERLRINDSGSTFATNIALSGNITMAGSSTVDGYDVSSLGSKLAGIETGATADQTASQIKTAYESNANTNAFTSALQTKLNNIETSATADQTASQIKTAYESNSNTEAFTTTLQSKLNGIANSANAYTLPTAAAGTKGGVKVGNGLSISSEVLSHTDTSSQASSNNSGRTYIQDITLDTYGHVTGLATASESVVNYTHPTHPGDDMSVDTGALSGATVISDLDFNVTTDTLGHVTDANATVSTRNITLANLGYTGATNANNITNNNQLTNGAGYVTSSSALYNGVDIGIGLNSVVSAGKDHISIGEAADATHGGGSYTSCVSIGKDAASGGGFNVSMGELASSANYGVAIGYKAHAGYKGKDGSAWTTALAKSNGVAIGYGAATQGQYGVAIGSGASAGDNNQALLYCVSLGYNAKNFSQGNWTMTIGGNGDFNTGIKAIYPGRTVANGYTDLGAAGYRWGQLYVQYATSVGSDERLKKDISVLSDAELRVANALRIKKYKLRAEAKPATTAQPLIEHEDSDGNMVIDQQLEIDAPAIVAKIRIGVIAQEVVAAFSAEGLDAMDYGIISGGTVADDDDMLGVSYDELEAFILAATMQRLNDLEARIAALE